MNIDTTNGYFFTYEMAKDLKHYIRILSDGKYQYKALEKESIIEEMKDLFKYAKENARDELNLY